MSIRHALFAAALAFAPVLAFAGPAAASDTKIFLVDSSDGYGIDTCIAEGAACGAAMAGAWCRAHDFAHAVSFGKVQSDALATPVSTGAPTRTACAGERCADAVAITCAK